METFQEKNIMISMMVWHWKLIKPHIGFQKSLNNQQNKKKISSQIQTQVYLQSLRKLLYFMSNNSYFYTVIKNTSTSEKQTRCFETERGLEEDQ